MNRLLIVEDEKDIQDLMVMHLRREGFETVTADDGQTAWNLLQEQSFQLAIVDWMLPGGVSGIELTRLLRAQPRHQSTAILMVTARAAETDIVAGLEVGADDYVTKPFELPVLMARVRALLRRQRSFQSLETATHLRPSAPESWVVGHLKISTITHEAHFREKKIDLTPYEFKLLLTLMKNAGRVLTRDRLIDEVQGSGVMVVDRAIDTHIFGLRKKLGKAAELIETVRGVGYRMAPPENGGNQS